MVTRSAEFREIAGQAVRDLEAIRGDARPEDSVFGLTVPHGLQAHQAQWRDTQDLWQVANRPRRIPAKRPRRTHGKRPRRTHGKHSWRVGRLPHNDRPPVFALPKLSTFRVSKPPQNRKVRSRQGRNVINRIPTTTEGARNGCRETVAGPMAGMSRVMPAVRRSVSPFGVVRTSTAPAARPGLWSSRPCARAPGSGLRRAGPRW